MDNNYYTPKPEEFYLGFEFEYKYITPQANTHWGIRTDEWQKCIFNTMEENTINNKRDIVTNIRESLFPDGGFGIAYRVEKLTKQNIISLGWTDIKTHYCYNAGTNHVGFVKSGKEKDMFNLLFTENIEGLDFPGVHISHAKNSESIVRYNGCVRNKSELNKLMKNLNII